MGLHEENHRELRLGKSTSDDGNEIRAALTEHLEKSVKTIKIESSVLGLSFEKACNDIKDDDGDGGVHGLDQEANSARSKESGNFETENIDAESPTEQLDTGEYELNSRKESCGVKKYLKKFTKSSSNLDGDDKHSFRKGTLLYYLDHEDEDATNEFTMEGLNVSGRVGDKNASATTTEAAEEIAKEEMNGQADREACINPRSSEGNTSARSGNCDTTEEEQETVDEAEPTGVDSEGAESPEFDYDGPFQEAETYDLANFDFEHLTKPDKLTLHANQEVYIKACQHEGLIPNAYIVRNLVTSSLIINSQSLGYRGIKVLCLTLWTNCHVTELEISEDNVDTKSMLCICDVIKENPFITQLDLSNNKMGRTPVKLLLETLTAHDHIVSLSLAGNCLEDTDGDIFVNYLKSTFILEELNLSYNRFRDEGAAVLGKLFAMNSTICSLSMRWNHIRCRGAVSFFAGIEKNSSIQMLDISWNGMGVEGTRALCKALRRNKTLEEVDISSNRLRMTSMRDLFAVLKKNKKLRTLTVANNIFTSVEISIFLKEMLTFKGPLCLKDLDFGNQTVDFNAISLVSRLLMEKDIIVSHGIISGVRETVINDADELANLNPVTVLIEFGRLLGMRVKELFDFMDKDGSKTLTRQEIKDGLMEFEIPLPERSLDLMIRKMDRDGDGEISISELITTGCQETRIRLKDTMKAKENHMSKNDTESSRCRKILKRLVAEHNKMKAASLKEKRLLDHSKKRAVKRNKPKTASSDSGGASPESKSDNIKDEEDEYEYEEQEYDDQTEQELRLPPILSNSHLVTGGY